MLPQEAQASFGLLEEEFGAWTAATARAWQRWRSIILKQKEEINGDWVGIFGNNLVGLPILVCCTGDDFHPKPSTDFHYIPVKVPVYHVRSQSASLIEVLWESRLTHAMYDAAGDMAYNKVAGCVRRVRIIEAKKGPKKQSLLLYYGMVQRLSWDPARYTWQGKVRLMRYTASLGRKYLLNTHPVADVVEKKWSGVLPISYRLQWLNTRDSETIKKEAGLIWAVWHKRVEVNAWRAKFARQGGIDQCCPMCLTGTRETVLHRFWECRAAAKVWRWGMLVMDLLAPRGVGAADSPEPESTPTRRDEERNSQQQRLVLAAEPEDGLRDAVSTQQGEPQSQGKQQPQGEQQERGEIQERGGLQIRIASQARSALQTQGAPQVLVAAQALIAT